ncbi:MAG: hypothetical protein ACLVKS_01295, partial [Peptococcus niger]
VPAPERVRLDAPADRLYWLADGQLYIGDLRRQTVEGPAVVNAQSRLVDMFISPTESRKLYLCPLGQADFGYYPDTGRSVPLYEMQERFYDTAPLSKEYFYANQWRQDEEGDAKGLWTVIADTRREVARVLARGSYADAYKTGVLLLGDQRFGLTLVPDFNAPEKSVRITDQYVYQTGFFAKGGIYWIGDNGLQQNATPGRPAYLLHILSPEGNEIKRLPLSGAAILVRATGKSAVCAGPAAESIDFANAEITDERSWQSRWLSAPLGLEETVSNTVRAFGNSLLGDKSALAAQRWPLQKKPPRALQQSDVTSDLSTNRHVEGHLRNALCRRIPVWQKEFFAWKQPMRTVTVSCAGCRSATNCLPGNGGWCSFLRLIRQGGGLHEGFIGMAGQPRRLATVAGGRLCRLASWRLLLAEPPAAGYGRGQSGAHAGICGKRQV